METTERLNSIDGRLEKLVTTSERQQQSVDRLSLAVERLTLVFANQSRDISELRAATTQLVESGKVSQQNIETSNYLAQRNLEAVRDLIEELRNKGAI